MTRRITKTMADEAAAKMMQKAYSKKIVNAETKINKAVEELVRKYVPAPVIACVGEYGTYFETTKVANITAIRQSKDSNWTSKEKYIHGQLPFSIPSGSRYITVEPSEYEALRKLTDKKEQIEHERDGFGKQVYDALIALRTDKAVEKELPEAMKYLTFPEVKAVPMPVFTGLRDIIGKICD